MSSDSLRAARALELDLDDAFPDSSGERRAGGLLEVPDDLDPVGAAAWTNMCTAFLECDHLRALHYAEEVLRARPANAIATAVVARAYEWLERFAKAAAEIEPPETLPAPVEDVVDLPSVAPTRDRRDSAIVTKPPSSRRG